MMFPRRGPEACTRSSACQVDDGLSDSPITCLRAGAFQTGYEHVREQGPSQLVIEILSVFVTPWTSASLGRVESMRL